MTDLYQPATTLYPQSSLQTTYSVKDSQDYYAVIYAQGLGLGELVEFNEGTRGIITFTTPREARVLLSQPANNLISATKVNVSST